MSGDRPGLAVLAAAAVGVQVGAATVASRFVLGETDPASLALWRYAIGFLCLIPFALAARPWRIAPRDLPAIAALGIVQFGALIWLLNVALLHIPAARAALILAAMPLFAMALAAALGREKLSAAKSGGVIVTLLGVALALGEKAFAPAAAVGGFWLGEAAALAAALCGGACSVLYRPFLRRYRALPVGALAMLAAALALAVLAGSEGFFGRAPRFSAGGWAAVVFVGASSGIGYFFWLWALGHASPTRVTVFLALSPIAAAALGALFLGEAVTLWLGAGTALVAAGLWLAHRPGGA